ncbi:DNA ligase [Paraglaciecola sp. 2405UD69-4]|uniref:DNA ligase n=1 Tax=Paraglaciecola sp. 2405UD69-4 TaxID=3391836 RepID=UPI0039C98995
MHFNYSPFVCLISVLLYFTTTTVALCSSQLQPISSAPTPQQLAHIYSEDVVISDYWISEKLDGIRARWTGSKLITRSGNTINAPAWYTKDFGEHILDGELWLKRNGFEQTTSIVLRDTPTQDWERVKFMLFDLPAHKGDFTQRLTHLKNLVEASHSPYLFLIPHFKLTNKSELMTKLDTLVAQGAEGLMLHHQHALYENGRSTKLLKLKKHQDAEAKVIGHIPGKGKYQNMLGALLVELENGLQFKIGTGFKDLQRQNPPEIGAIITFKHYGFTAKGVPRFASFMRVRPKSKQ